MVDAANEQKQNGNRAVIIFAGPNGSGKSTANAKVLNDPAIGFDGTYINADDIAKTLTGNFSSPQELNIAAAEQAETRRNKCLESGESFAFETVMSTPEKVALMSQARARGYDVHLVFVTTSDPAINAARVANRVALGGHDVPFDAIYNRYESAMKLLPVAIEQATSVYVFDNSEDGREAILVAQKSKGGELEIAVNDNTPSWAKERLQVDHDDRLASLAMLGQALQAKGFTAGVDRLEMAEAANGISYDGKTIAATTFHVLQQGDQHHFLLHSRALAQDRAYRVGAQEKVTYAYERGKTKGIDKSLER